MIIKKRAISFQLLAISHQLSAKSPLKKAGSMLIAEG
jgi:hypothetical protein